MGDNGMKDLPEWNAIWNGVGSAADRLSKWMQSQMQTNNEQDPMEDGRQRN